MPLSNVTNPKRLALIQRGVCVNLEVSLETLVTSTLLARFHVTNKTEVDNMAEWSSEKLWGWGRYPVVDTLAARPERLSDVAKLLAKREKDPVLPFGLGRSYGDSNLLGAGRMIKTERLNRIHDFDAETGWLRCEAGVSLKELIELFVPKGFPSSSTGYSVCHRWWCCRQRYSRKKPSRRWHLLRPHPSNGYPGG